MNLDLKTVRLLITTGKTLKDLENTLLTLEEKEKEEKRLEDEYFQSFIGKYVKIIHNNTSVAYFQITDDARKTGTFLTLFVRNFSCQIDHSHLNHLWLLDAKNWVFVTKEEFEEVKSKIEIFNKEMSKYLQPLNHPY